MSPPVCLVSTLPCGLRRHPPSPPPLVTLPTGLVGAADSFGLRYGKLANPLPPARVAEIVGAAVAMEKEFVREALPVELIGMNSTAMCQ